MRTPYTCPLTRSLPYVLAAIAIACSSTDAPRPDAPAESAGKIPENAAGGSSVAGGSPIDDNTSDDDALDTTEVGRSDPNVDDVANNGASAGPDSDRDGLPDSVETNTKRFVDKNNTGTDPNNWDTDDDGISDGDEVLVTAGGLDLAKMGTNPLHQDILLEYDWFEDSSECATHSHKPKAAVLNMVKAAFAASPAQNPDKKTGINVIQDYGQGGAFTGGSRLISDDVVLDKGVDGAEYKGHFDNDFAKNRQGYFHYVLMSHRYTYQRSDGTWETASTGQAHRPSNDMIVSLACWHADDFKIAATIVHELGHNLGLQHGGRDDVNWKPNYNSIMNYKYQLDGIATDCTPQPNKKIDYSRNKGIVLDEHALDETAGICGTPRWDWNGDKKFDTNISLDINDDGSLGILRDYDDWGTIRLPWKQHSPLEKRDEAVPQTVSCESFLPGT